MDEQFIRKRRQARKEGRKEVCFETEGMKIYRSTFVVRPEKERYMTVVHVCGNSCN